MIGFHGQGCEKIFTHLLFCGHCFVSVWVESGDPPLQSTLHHNSSSKTSPCGSNPDNKSNLLQVPIQKTFEPSLFFKHPQQNYTISVTNEQTQKLPIQRMIDKEQRPTIVLFVKADWITSIKPQQTNHYKSRIYADEAAKEKSRRRVMSTFANVEIQGRERMRARGIEICREGKRWREGGNVLRPTCTSQNRRVAVNAVSLTAICGSETGQISRLSFTQYVYTPWQCK